MAPKIHPPTHNIITNSHPPLILKSDSGLLQNQTRFLTMGASTTQITPSILNLKESTQIYQSSATIDLYQQQDSSTFLVL